MKKLLIIAMMFSLSFTAFAQRGQQREMPTPEQRAEMMTNRMAEKLELSEDQKKKIYDIHLENAKKRQAEREARRAEMEGKREEMNAQRQKQNDQIEAVLTPEQKTKYAEMKASARERGAMRPGRAGEKRPEMRKGQGQRGGQDGKFYKGGEGRKGPKTTTESI